MSFSVFDYLKVRYNPDNFRYQIFLGNPLQPLSLKPNQFLSYLYFQFLFYHFGRFFNKIMNKKFLQIRRSFFFSFELLL